MSGSPRSPFYLPSSESEEDTRMTESEPEELPYTSESDPEEAPLSPAEAHSVAEAPRSPASGPVEESDSSAESAPTLEGLAAELRRTRVSISLLHSVIDRMGRSLDAVVAHNRELTEELRSCRARLAGLAPLPPGLSNQDISDRVDHMEHLYQNLQANTDHDIAHLVIDFTMLQVRVDGPENQAQEAQIAAMIDPPPEEEAGDEGEDARSEVSDASDASDPMEP